MLETIIFLCSFADYRDFSRGEVFLDQLRQENSAFNHAIHCDVDSENLIDFYNRIKKSLNFKSESHCSMILAIGEKGLKALSELNSEAAFEKVRPKIAVSTKQYFDVISELGGVLDLIAIPEPAIDSGSKKSVIKHIPSFIPILSALPNTPEEINNHVALARGISLMFRKQSSGSRAQCIPAVAALGGYILYKMARQEYITFRQAVVGGMYAVYEVMRKGKITPKEGALLSIPIIFFLYVL